MIKEFCDKMKGKSFCDDCDDCSIGGIIKEHDAKVRADAIDELLKILSPCYDCNACEEESKNYFQNSCMSEMLDYEEIVERAKQLKEQKNEEI